MITTLSDTRLHATPNAEMRRYPGSSVAVWQTTMDPGAVGPVHRIDREQVVVVLAGRLDATIDDREDTAGPGDAVLLPAGSVRQLRNQGAEPLVTITCALPGSLATVGAGEPVSVPWSQ